MIAWAGVRCGFSDNGANLFQLCQLRLQPQYLVGAQRHRSKQQQQRQQPCQDHAPMPVAPLALCSGWRERPAGHQAWISGQAWRRRQAASVHQEDRRVHAPAVVFHAFHAWRAGSVIFRGRHHVLSLQLYNPALKWNSRRPPTRPCHASDTLAKPWQALKSNYWLMRAANQHLTQLFGNHSMQWDVAKTKLTINIQNQHYQSGTLTRLHTRHSHITS